jgi:putative endonuclease
VAIGQQYEARALQKLMDEGAQPIARNFRCQSGEIDLIVCFQNLLVFCEVKYRFRASQGRAVEQVTRQKIQRIIRTSEYFLLKHPQYQRYFCRYDVIGFDGEHMEWIQDAFQLT